MVDDIPTTAACSPTTSLHYVEHFQQYLLHLLRTQDSLPHRQDPACYPGWTPLPPHLGGTPNNLRCHHPAPSHSGSRPGGSGIRFVHLTTVLFSAAPVSGFRCLFCRLIPILTGIDGTVSSATMQDRHPMILTTASLLLRAFISSAPPSTCGYCCYFAAEPAFRLLFFLTNSFSVNVEGIFHHLGLFVVACTQMGRLPATCHLRLPDLDWTGPAIVASWFTPRCYAATLPCLLLLQAFCCSTLHCALPLRMDGC